MLLLRKSFKFFSYLELNLIKDSFYDVRGHMWVVFGTNFFFTKVGETRWVNQELKMMEQNIWNCILSEFKLQSRLFMGIFSVLPKSTISLTIAGGVISSGQEGMIQSSYFCQSSKLSKNICEKIHF